MANASATWLGHASFRFDSAGGKRIYLDPWLGNPKCPESEKRVERVDVLALTHAHSDHIGSAIEIAKAHSPTIVAQFDLAGWMERQGVEGASELGMNRGGTVDVDGIQFTFTDARHSSTTPDGSYGGAAGGYVIRFEDGTKVYASGDTCVFGDMQLIGRIYEPDVAILPIGDHFTMGPRAAAVALELLGVRRCIPCHYGTFPVLSGPPGALRELAGGVEILDVEPGQTIEL